MAHFDEHAGRKRLSSLSVLLLALPTPGIGWLPMYVQIGQSSPSPRLLRAVQGIAVGGELPGAWVLVAEYVPSTRIGLAWASFITGLPFDSLLGGLLAAAIHRHLMPSELLGWGQRVAFLRAGALVAPRVEQDPRIHLDARAASVGNGCAIEARV